MEELLGLRSKQDVLAFLRSTGFDVARAARATFTGDEPVGTLLVGSVAEGYQTASSDIDILFVSYTSRVNLRSGGHLVISSGQSSETLTYASGVEINTEVVCWEDYSSLADKLDQVAGATARGGGLTKLPMLDKYTLRYLHRLRTGLVLDGADVVDQFRADFHVGSLPLYLSVKNLVLAREALEDARSAPHETAGLVEYSCRNVLEYCLLAFAAALGFTSQSRRFVMNWIDGLNDDDPHLPALVELRDRFLSNHALAPEQKAHLIAGASASFEVVRSALREDRVRRRVIDRIFESIPYAY
ncbi:hypothetical protein [Nocardioides zeae]|uniref:Polymerase nucleotidyl transferase domain-containing protein n=1 Tax=Nocardioides zeae TaxID=1457234 RepID=A0A6P0HLS0_9ACTN|nr:hypothetical protein [Nocardioides zeae]NEN79551.1 hypothetical protein [Nocardioides zeae]